MILLNIEHQSVASAVYDSAVSDSIKYLSLKCRFTSDWDGLLKTVVLNSGEYSVSLVLDENDCYTAERGLELPAGDWEIRVIGVEGSGEEITKRITAIGESLHVIDFGSTEGSAPTEIAPSYGEQIAAIAHDAKTAATAAQASAEASTASAKSYSESAQASAQSASSSATTAQSAASSAQSSASSASNAKNQASASASTAKSDADRAEAAIGQIETEEAVRAAAEASRIMAENARVSAESSRESKLNSAIAAIPGQVDSAVSQTIDSRIETSLAEAKASGEFDGKDGVDGTVLFATFEVDQNGDLLMHTPDGFSDIEFRLNQNYELEVVI